MPFIKVITPDEATGKLASLYQLVGGPGGQVDQVLQAHSLRPHTLEGHMALYKSVLHHRGNKLEVWFLEAIGVLVSRLNGCQYCDRHHTAGLEGLMKKEGLDFPAYDQSLRQNPPGAPFSQKQQAALGYVIKLTRSPGAIQEVDIDHLRKQGFSDGEILEINQVTAYFAYANRSVSGLGVSIEGEVLGLSPQSGDGREAWQHD